MGMIHYRREHVTAGLSFCAAGLLNAADQSCSVDGLILSCGPLPHQKLQFCIVHWNAALSQCCFDLCTPAFN